MEQQFVLRLPERLRNMDTKDFRLLRTSHSEVVLHVKDESYSGIICRLPTIVESQKYIDNKLYKIADISTLVVIYENNDFSLEDEIRKYECSGLTPPMGYAKERRFNTTAIGTEEVEKIERKVAELLREDSNAIKVEVITNEKDSSDVDLDIFAAEIENDASASRETRSPSGLQTGPVPPKDEAPSSRLPYNEPYDGKMKSNPQNTHARRKSGPDKDADQWHQAKTPDPSIPGKAALVSEAYLQETNSTAAQNASLSHTSLHHHTFHEERQPHQQIRDKVHPALIELENKIKEKQDMLDRAVNPILKKRFEQSLGELKAEHEKKKNELAR